jgi:hypothetical protein
MTNDKTIESLDAYIADRSAKIQRLETQYGTGVRPGWVGEEIAILEFYVRDAIAARNELEANNATDHSSN